MEAAVGKHKTGLVGGNALDVVSPTTSKLAGRLPRLDTRVHGKHALVTEILGHELGILAKSVVVERTGCQCDLLGLLEQGIDEDWMRMSLVDAGVRGQAVEIALAFNIPDMDTLAARENNGECVAVVGRVLALKSNVLLGSELLLDWGGTDSLAGSADCGGENGWDLGGAGSGAIRA